MIREAARGPLFIVFLIVFLDLLAFGIIIPILPFYTLHFGLTAFWGGVLMASYSLMQFLFAPVWGRWSDRVGRRPVLLVSVAGTAVSMALFGVATSFWVLLGARVLAGVMGANISTAQAYVADVTTAENRSKGMGLVGAAIGLGFVLGPAAGGFLGEYGYWAPSIAAAGLAVVNFTLAWFRLPESLPPGTTGPPPGARRSVFDHRAFVEGLRRPVLGPLLVVGFLGMVAFSAMEASFGFFAWDAHRWGELEVGLALTYVGLLLVVVQGGAIGPLTRVVGERRLLVWGLAGVCLGLTLLPLALPSKFLFLSLGVLALSQGLAAPSLSSFVSQVAAVEEQGAILGLFQSLQSLGRVIGPLWGTAAYTGLGVGAPFKIGAALTGVAVFVALVASWQWSARRAPARDEEPPTPAQA